MFIWLRRVFSEFVSITYWRTSPYLHTGKQRRCHHVCLAVFYRDIFMLPSKGKTTFSNLLHWFLPSHCRNLFVKFFRGHNSDQSQRGFVGHIGCSCLGPVFNSHERNRKIGFPNGFHHTEDFRLRAPLHASSIIV